MKTRIQKWGNSLAIRIPKPFAEETGLQQESAVELHIEDGQLVVRPIVEQSYSLDALLAQVTDDNVHSEVDAGAAFGSEIW